MLQFQLEPGLLSIFGEARVPNQFGFEQGPATRHLGSLNVTLLLTLSPFIDIVFSLTFQLQTVSNPARVD